MRSWLVPHLNHFWWSDGCCSRWIHIHLQIYCQDRQSVVSSSPCGRAIVYHAKDRKSNTESMNLIFASVSRISTRLRKEFGTLPNDLSQRGKVMEWRLGLSWLNFLYPTHSLTIRKERSICDSTTRKVYFSNQRRSWVLSQGLCSGLSTHRIITRRLWDSETILS